jgi:hypothetical protein
MGLKELLPASNTRFHEPRPLTIWQEFGLFFGDATELELFALLDCHFSALSGESTI